MSKFCMSCMEQYRDEYELCPHCGFVEGTKNENALHINPGEILQDRYIVGKPIGFGGFGVTYIGWDALLEHKIAIKEYMPSEFSTRSLGTKEVTVFGGKKEEQFHNGLKKFHEEAKKLARFNTDDGIVRVYDSFEENNTAYIIMELLEGETLAAYLEREKVVPVEKAINIIIPIAKALKSVHADGVIHRDIAPDNIFLTNDGKVKLIDFGAARFATTSHSRSLSVLIKQGYSPEEQYRSRGDQGTYTDIYALGAVLYKMVTGVTPPDALERRAYFENKKKDILTPISKYVKDIPSNRENAILNALNVRIEDRTQTTEDFIAELTSDEPVQRKKGKIKAIDFLSWPLWAKITFPSLATLVLTLTILFATGVIGFENNILEDIYVPDGMSRVPSIVNTDMESAEKRINDAILLYSIVGKEYSNVIPANLILNQSIDGGSVVVHNSMLELVISAGAETKIVPNLTGMYSEEAVAALEELGFLVKLQKEYNSSIAEDGVVLQSVESNTVYPIGNEITLVISLGRDPSEEYEDTLIEVPRFVGKTYEEALDLAQKSGLQIVAKEKAYSSEYEENIVMKQNAEPGTDIMSSNVIELTISLGVKIVKVPDVQYKDEATAISMLKESELKASISYEESDTVKAGLVISQSPASGVESAPGETISLVISKGATAFSMPNVVGMSESEAKSTLGSKGLSVTVNYEYSSASDTGKVLKQSVSANANVYAGTAVTIVVSSGAELIIVPNVSSSSEKSAISTLNDKGFEVKVNEAYSETVDKGYVIEQNPGAGSSQVKGSNILITISKGKSPIELPNVVGMSQSIAESTIKSYNLNISLDYEYSETVAAGAVISQLPKSGTTVYSEDNISIVISKGKEPIAIPNVVRSSQSSATSTLKDKGFSVVSSQEYSDTVSSGYVISQSPKSGTTGYKGDTINIVISKGKAPVSPTGVVIQQNNAAVSSITIIGIGNTSQLTAIVSPSDATDKSVIWSSSNTSVATVTNGQVKAIGEGEATITVKTNTAGKTTTCKVKVEKIKPSSISVNSNPTKTSYYKGDTLNTSGLSLTIKHNNGTSTTVNSGFTCSPTTLNTVGTQKITVSYSELTTSFNVTVAEVKVSSISVKSNPSKMSYFIDDTLNTSGLVLNVKYNNGSSTTVSSGFSCLPTSLGTAGTQKINVSYGGQTTSFNVTVNTPKVTLSTSSGSSSDTHVYYGSTTKAFYAGIFNLPSASANTGSSISWSVVSGNATVSGGKLYINQSDTVVARASITYNGKTYSADYTYTRKLKVSIDTGLSLRTEPRVANDTYILTIPVGNVLDVTAVSDDKSTYVWGKVTYNGKTGWVALWKRDRSESGGIITV